VSITLSISFAVANHIPKQDYSHKVKKLTFTCRLLALESRIREPGSVACIDSLLDTVTAIIADCSHDPIRQLKNIEAYTNRCKIDLISNT